MRFPVGVGVPPEADYTENSLIGYRWYDYNEVVPAYCFGHGLSFSSFSYGPVKVSQSSSPFGVRIDFDITNTGLVTGSEVAQVYLSSPLSTDTTNEPKRQLKHFLKLKDLKPDTATSVSFLLSERDLSTWDEKLEGWSVVEGTYTVFVGTSSCDFRQTTSFDFYM